MWVFLKKNNFSNCHPRRWVHPSPFSRFFSCLGCPLPGRSATSRPRQPLLVRPARCVCLLVQDGGENPAPPTAYVCEGASTAPPRSPWVQALLAGIGFPIRDGPEGAEEGQQGTPSGPPRRRRAVTLPLVPAAGLDRSGVPFPPALGRAGPVRWRCAVLGQPGLPGEGPTRREGQRNGPNVPFPTGVPAAVIGPGPGPLRCTGQADSRDRLRSRAGKGKAPRLP
jgi:hypothetical protein